MNGLFIVVLCFMFNLIWNILIKKKKMNEIKFKKCWVKCILNYVINLIKIVLIILNRIFFFFYDIVLLKLWNILIIILLEY